jgi:hypothetical protein
MKQLGLSIIVAIGLTLPALANSPQHKGDYVFTFSEVCLVSPSGFSANAALPVQKVIQKSDSLNVCKSGQSLT